MGVNPLLLREKISNPWIFRWKKRLFSHAIPEVDFRKHPKMADTSPSTLAFEGSEPQKNRWPKVKHTIPEAERCVYPGEGIILRDGS